jgi:hypothetical protein
LSWDPSASSSVCALAISGDNVYIGGVFTSISSAERRSFAIVNTSGSLASTDLSKFTENATYSVIVTERSVYVQGFLSPIGIGINRQTGRTLNA